MTTYATADQAFSAFLEDHVNRENPAAPLWPTVTGLPGSPPVVFEDPSLPHQIVLLFHAGSRIAVSCNCLGRRDGVKRELIEVRTTFPAPAAIASWRAWHAARGIEVTP